MDALGLKRAALVGHSQAGNPAVQLALKEPARYSHVIVLGTGSLLPPLDGAGEVEGAGTAAPRTPHGPSGAEHRGHPQAARGEPLPSRPDHDDELALRHARSVGKAFDAFVARNREGDSAPAKEPKTPMWQRLTEVQCHFF
jgi:pimeloyl-ACP methyl ester carboxylesterase